MAFIINGKQIAGADTRTKKESRIKNKFDGRTVAEILTEHKVNPILKLLELIPECDTKDKIVVWKLLVEYMYPKPRDCDHFVSVENKTVNMMSVTKEDLVKAINKDPFLNAEDILKPNNKAVPRDDKPTSQELVTTLGANKDRQGTV